MRRSPEELERVRRSVAMLTPGQPGLGREEAMAVLAELAEVSRELDRLRAGMRDLLDGR